MILVLRSLVLLLLAGGVLALSPAAARAQEASAADTARFLAGVAPVSASRLQAWTSDASWRQHQAAFDAAWARLERAQLGKIRSWTADHLESKRPTLFYMFSGPDYLHADAFFPDAQTYVLSGLEPVGPIPVVSEANRRGLGRLRSALNSVLSNTFFRTIDMRSDLATGGSFGGTLPILYVFLARAGKTVQEASLVRLDQTGAVEPMGGPLARGQPSGVRIKFTDKDGEERTLYYFQVDVSNSGPYVGAFLDFCRTLGTGDAFIKSASYLLHVESFSRVREFLLANTQLIVQDDSGIPIRHFAADRWEVLAFGRYTGPIGLFANHYQSQVAALFAKERPPALEFGIGYRVRPAESSLLVAVRRPQ